MNANETLRHHNCSETLYSYIYNTVITDGVKDLADTFECYWLIDIIASYQLQLQTEEFQIWEIQKFDDESALVRCTDGNGRQLKLKKLSGPTSKPNLPAFGWKGT